MAKKEKRGKQATFYGAAGGWEGPAGGGDPEVDPLTPPLPQPVRPVVVEVVLVVVVDGVARWAVTVNPSGNVARWQNSVPSFPWIMQGGGHWAGSKERKGSHFAA